MPTRKMALHVRAKYNVSCSAGRRVKSMLRSSTGSFESGLAGWEHITPADNHASISLLDRDNQRVIVARRME